jgi:serine/threonine protein kinase
VSTLSPERWQEISPYLDQALTLPEDERAAWLESFRATNPPLADLLELLLEEHRALAQEHFLERRPPQPSNESSLAGQTIGAYTLISPIGQGGMGSVWLGERSDGRFERQVAVKFLNVAVTGQGGAERFKREGSILGRLAHPHIAELIDAGVSASGQPYLVLEYVGGEHIDEYCDGHLLDVDARIKLFLDVLSALALAHANLTVHRDIKPSNVLVSNDGRVKLLDFGIAKLLGGDRNPGAAALTLEGGGALTPQFAAPEQVTGGAITTATDVYALGVLLYMLLTGQHPAGSGAHSTADLVKAIVDSEPQYPSDALTSKQTEPEKASAEAAKRATTPDKLRRQLRGDLDTIISKALKKNPAERYISVTALADDLQRYLKHETISARPDTVSYRAARFVRRNRAAVLLTTSALVLVITSLSTGLYVANRERKIAERRFIQVRQLANQFLALDTTIQALPGAIPARHQIVSTALAYLEGLSSEVHNDRDLALEVGTAYLQVAQVQGVPTGSNLGDFAEADKTLAKGEKFVDAVLRGDPKNRRALFISAGIAHARMILATGGPREAVLAQASKATDRMVLFLALGNANADEIATASHLFINVGNAYINLHLYDDAIRSIRRAAEISQSVKSAQRMHALALSRLAQSLRYRGDFEGALQSITQAQAVLETAPYSSEMQRLSAMADVLATKGSILGQEDIPSLGRAEEAISALREAFDITEQMAARDRDDSRSRFTEVQVGGEFAGTVSQRNPKQALAIYDQVLSRVRETKDSPNHKSNEANCLADSALTLLQLDRVAEAKRRIDVAFGLLREAGDYPSARIDIGSSAAHTLRASAAYQETIGQSKRAVETYEELLNVTASNLKPQTELPDAYYLSRLFAELAPLYQKTGQPDKAGMLLRNRRELWRRWDRELPNNDFVRRQLQMAGYVNP